MEEVLELHYFVLPKIMQAVCHKYNKNYVNRCAEVVTAMNADAVFRERIRAHEDAASDPDLN